MRPGLVLAGGTVILDRCAILLTREFPEGSLVRVIEYKPQHPASRKAVASSPQSPRWPLPKSRGDRHGAGATARVHEVYLRQMRSPLSSERGFQGKASKIPKSSGPASSNESGRDSGMRSRTYSGFNSGIWGQWPVPLITIGMHSPKTNATI